MISPGRIRACPNCKKDVTVNRRKAWVALLPLLLAVLFGGLLDPVPLQIALNVSASLLGIVLYVFWVPLEKR